MTKKKSSLVTSLVVVFLISVLYAFLLNKLSPDMQGGPILIQFFGIVYLWGAGVLGLIFAKREGISLPIFKKPNKTFWLTPLFTLLIIGLAFVVTIPFGILNGQNPVIENMGGVALTFVAVISYVVITILGSFLFLGEELYWRGYLLEKLKKYGALRMIGTIAILWALWQLPFLLVSYDPMSSSMKGPGLGILTNLALTPLLFYYRLKGKSIFSSAFFHSSFMAAMVFGFLLFPTSAPKIINMLSLASIGVLLVVSFAMKLFSPSTWKKLL